MPRSAFFGTRTGPFSTPTSAFLRMGTRNGGGASRYAVGPVRVVNEKVVGIDLGTTNSAVAAMEGGKPTIVTNAEGQRTTPSVVAYTKSGDRLVGQIAKRQAVVNPENTFFSVKRFIGRKMNEVDEESKQVSYRVVRDENGNVKLECPAINKQFAAEEISAQVFKFTHFSPISIDKGSVFSWLQFRIRYFGWFCNSSLIFCVLISEVLFYFFGFTH